MPKVFLERHGFHVHLGKLDAAPVADALRFKDARAIFVRAGGVLPRRPVDWGHAGDFRTGPTADGGWGMLGNGPCDDGSITDTSWAAYDGAGDCAWACPAHDEMEAAVNAGRPVPPFTCLNVLEQYSAYIASVNDGNGYDLQTGANDNGSVIADVIAWRQSKGLLDVNGVAYRLGQAVTGTPGDLDAAYEMAYLFNTIDTGFVLTDANMTQFDDGEPWDYVAGSAQVGGHCVPIPGKRLITWARPHRFTGAFFREQNDEVHAEIDLEQYNAVTGEDAQHYTEQDAEKFLTLVARRQAAA